MKLTQSSKKRNGKNTKPVNKNVLSRKIIVRKRPRKNGKPKNGKSMKNRRNWKRPLSMKRKKR
jgi:hypothetical protein